MGLDEIFETLTAAGYGVRRKGLTHEQVKRLLISLTA
jgi:hypothetical protein